MVTIMDNDALTQRIAELERINSSLHSDMAALTDVAEKLRTHNEELRATNKRLVDMLWGRRSERRASDSHAPFLPGEDWLGAQVETTQEIIAGEESQAVLDVELIRKWEEQNRRRREQRKRDRGSSQAFPAHLERRERLLDLTEEQKADLQYIGDDVTERLRFEQPHVYVERIVRRKYVKPGEPEQGVVSASVPLSIVEGCKYDFSVIAAIIALKYAFHQPTYRQQDWYAQCGWFPNRSTINDLINYGVTTIVPLVAQMWQLLLQQTVLLMDETVVRLLTRGALSEEQLAQIRKRKISGSPEEQATLNDPSHPGSVASYAWLFTSLDHMAPYNVFHWSLTRQQSTLDEMLADYCGTIVADAYDAYAHVYERSEGRITHASCNSHARREFVKAEMYEPILCAQIISLYRQLYDIEDRATSWSAEARLEVRQREAVLIWKAIDAWRHSDRVVLAARPSSPFGKAVGYLTNQWNALRRYLSDGELPISNDQSERIIRPLTVGRRNWMFLGHPAAAPGRMQLLSIVSSAHRHHLVVEDYLKDILTKLADAQQNHPHDFELGSPYLLDLLPDRWRAAHPESVRSERIAENQDVTEARRVRRAKRRLAQRAEKLAAQQPQPQPPATV